MAYGFQNTCDTDEYFYLDNVPGYVSVNEFFYIETLEGENFCGKYVDIPAVDYQILTYSLLGMTAQTNSSVCQQINPCPTVLINFPVNAGVSTNVNECACLTEYPLGVECIVPNVTPQNPNVTVNLKISGGTAPYTIYSANTDNQLGTVSTNGGTSNIGVPRPSGTYCFDVYDFYQTKVSHCCTVSSAATLLSATYSKVNTNQCNNSGSVTVNINGGTPPYTVYKNGMPQGEMTQFTELGTSTNTFYVTDSSTPTQQTLPSIQNITVIPITYPTNICMSFTLCGQQFNLNFTKSATAICPQYYLCDNPGIIGSTGFYLTGDTTTNSWGTTEFSVDSSQISLPGNCSLTSSTGRFVKTATSQQAAGEYTGQGAFAQATNITVSNGACLITPTFTYQVVGTCSGLYEGAITISPNVTPFVATLDGIARPQNISVFNNLGGGDHTLFITSNGVQSSTQTINVPSSVGSTESSSTCEVPITSTSPSASYTFQSKRTYTNIPQNVTVTANLNRTFILLLRFLNASDLDTYTFSENYAKIYKNGQLLFNITSGAGNANIYSNSTYVLGNCSYNDRAISYTPTSNNQITIQNGDEFTFETNFSVTMNSTESVNINCDESIQVQARYLLLNVTDDSSSCFTFANSTPVAQTLSLNRNSQTNVTTAVFQNNYTACP